MISSRKEMKNDGVKLHLDQRLSKQNCKCSYEDTKLLKGRINKSILKTKHYELQFITGLWQEKIDST